MRPDARTLLLFLSTVSLTSCAVPDELGEATSASCTTIDNRSLIETDATIITDERFSLARVFEQMRATTPRGNGAQTLAVPTIREMFAQLWQDYGTCDGARIDPHGYGLKCRPEEASVALVDPFTASTDGLHFQPVALINRFDLAGARSSSCGESRIVYWKDRGPVVGKAGFIIELNTPPVIERGRRSCAPIVEFWASLSREEDPARRAAMLEQFYYRGLPGMPFAPISARGAGWDGPGQLRSNNFVGFAQWHMREVKYQQVCEVSGGVPTCAAKFVLVDTKGSPSQKLFAGTHTLAPYFQQWFVHDAVPRLAAATDAGELSLGNDPRFNAYESISQPKDGDPTSVRYAAAASPALREQVTAKLTALGSPLTADHVFERATAVTCAGCHRLSKAADLGGGMVLPSPLGFVHVGEAGALSPAMTETLLPNRRDAFEMLACSAPVDAPAGETGDTLTILGKPIGETH